MASRTRPRWSCRWQATASAPSICSSACHAPRWGATAIASASLLPTRSRAGPQAMTAFSPARLSDRSARSGRHYPWLIVAGMALVVAVNGVLIYFAVSSFTGLATDDPYDKGLAFNQAAAAATAEAARGWQVDVAAAAAAGSQPAIAVAANFRDRA